MFFIDRCGSSRQFHESKSRSRGTSARCGCHRRRRSFMFFVDRGIYRVRETICNVQVGRKKSTTHKKTTVSDHRVRSESFPEPESNHFFLPIRSSTSQILSCTSPIVFFLMEIFLPVEFICPVRSSASQNPSPTVFFTGDFFSFFPSGFYRDRS